MFGTKKKKEMIEASSKVLINHFDEKGYLDANPDVKIGIDNGQFRDVKHHLETFGLAEIEEGLRKFHKDFELFNEVVYLESIPEVSAAVKNGEFASVFEHFCKVGYSINL